MRGYCTAQRPATQRHSLPLRSPFIKAAQATDHAHLPIITPLTMRSMPLTLPSFPRINNISFNLHTVINRCKENKRGRRKERVRQTYRGRESFITNNQRLNYSDHTSGSSKSIIIMCGFYITPLIVIIKSRNHQLCPCRFVKKMSKRCVTVTYI